MTPPSPGPSPADPRETRLRAFADEWRANEERQRGEQRWLRWATATVVCLAVAASLSALKYATFSNRTIARLNESAVRTGESSVAWQDHEVLRLRAYLFELHKERLSLEVEGARGSVSPPVLDDMLAHLRKYDELARRYLRDRARQERHAQQIEKHSDHLIRQADRAERHVTAYALTITIFQIGIAFVSLSLILRRRWPWYVGLLMLGAGMLQAANATWLWL
jgi:hypothetical protein